MISCVLQNNFAFHISKKNKIKCEEIQQPKNTFLSNVTLRMYRFGNRHFCIFWFIPLHLRWRSFRLNATRTEQRSLTVMQKTSVWKWVTNLRGLFLNLCCICSHTACLWKETFSGLLIRRIMRTVRPFGREKEFTSFKLEIWSAGFI